MIYLNYSDLNEEAKDRLLSCSKKDVTNKFGTEIRRYARENQTDFKMLIEEEAMRNLYNYQYRFKI